MKKHFRALLINCSTGNEKEDKKHDNELRNLEGELEDSWDVGKCNLIRLSQKNKSNINNYMYNEGMITQCSLFLLPSISA